MAEERGPARDYSAWRPKPASWTKLFGTFICALGLFKLLIAAGGILATAIGWYILSYVAFGLWTTPKLDEDGANRAEYDRHMATWALMYELAGPTKLSDKGDAELYRKWYSETHPDLGQWNAELANGYGGQLRTMPWAENRGPNAFHVVRRAVAGGQGDRRFLADWLVTQGFPNVLEPLLKFMTPALAMFDSRASLWVDLYLLLMLLWFVIVWAFCGGVITRIAVLQLAGKEGGGVRESIAFVARRYRAYLLSPMFAIGLIAFFILCCVLFGILHWAPIFGDLVDAIFWFLPLLAGLIITLLLIGLVGFPLMFATLSAEGSDSFDACTRSYNYIVESPWHYIFYSLVAIAYGAVMTLFVVVVASGAVYLAKWGVGRWPAYWADRSPEFLFAYAPESYGWRQLLVEGSPIAIKDNGQYVNQEEAEAYMANYRAYNTFSARMSSLWVTLLFMMVIGFSYSYFWTASMQIYLLMRKRVDETDMDEIYIEDEAPPPPTGPSVPTAPATPTPTAPVSVPVDPPTLRTPDAPANTAYPAQSGGSSPTVEDKPAG